MTTSILTGCDFGSSSINQENFKILKEEYEMLKETQKETDNLNTFLQDELTTTEENFDEYKESIWKNLVPQFKDNIVRNPGDKWDIDGKFSMYIEPSLSSIGTVTCRYKISDGSASTYDSETISFYSDFVYTKNEFLFGTSSLFDEGVADSAGYYPCGLHFFDENESATIYIDVIVAIDGKLSATTFMYSK